MLYSGRNAKRNDPLSPQVHYHSSHLQVQNGGHFLRVTPRFDRLRSDAYCPSQCSCKLTFPNDDTLLAKWQNPVNPFGNFEPSRSKALSSSDSHLTQNFSENRVAHFQKDVSIISRPFSTASNKEIIQLTHCTQKEPTPQLPLPSPKSDPYSKLEELTPGSRVNLLLSYGRKYTKKEPRIVLPVQKEDNSESSAHKQPEKKRRKIKFINNKLFPQIIENSVQKVPEQSEQKPQQSLTPADKPRIMKKNFFVLNTGANFFSALKKPNSNRRILKSSGTPQGGEIKTNSIFTYSQDSIRKIESPSSHQKRNALLHKNPSLALGLISPMAFSPAGGLPQTLSPISDMNMPVGSSMGSNTFNFSKLTNLAAYSIEISPMDGTLDQAQDNFANRAEKVDKQNKYLADLQKSEDHQRYHDEEREDPDHQKFTPLPPLFPQPANRSIYAKSPQKIERANGTPSRSSCSSNKLTAHRKSLFSESGTGRAAERSLSLKSKRGSRGDLTQMSHLTVTVGDEFTTTNVSQYKEKGRKIINQYIVLKEIARGSHGKVKQVLDKDSPNKKMYAMKIIKRDRLLTHMITKDQTAIEAVSREVAIMKKLDHAHVVKLVEVMDDPRCSKIYLVMELLSGGSVLQLMEKRRCARNPAGALTMKEAHDYFVQLILGLEYCHEAVYPPIIHRDIKPDNLLLDANQEVLKIADFGIAKIVQNSIDSGTIGSAYFMAPEVTQGIKHNGKASDIWSCGVTLYKMVVGKYPFTGPYIYELYQNIQNKEPEYPESMNPLLKDLLCKIFEKDSFERITMNEIKRHDWITSNGVTVLPETSRTSLSVEPEDIEGAITSVFKNKEMRITFRKH